MQPYIFYVKLTSLNVYPKRSSIFSSLITWCLWAFSWGPAEPEKKGLDISKCFWIIPATYKLGWMVWLAISHLLEKQVKIECIK
jgi:hypothetical protein